jgi:dTDP-4-amino-4,6-dideoxygalactose transaminase
VTEAVAQTTLALPFFNELTEAEAQAVAEALKRAVELEGRK